MKILRDRWAIGVWAAIAALPFLGQAYHMDETLYLAVARNILAEPLHPLSFLYNWHGTPRPAALILGNPLLFPYLLAAALKLSGGGELLTRLLLWPLDLAAGLSLYALARRFLKRPLLPVLIALASPAYLVNMNHAMADKAMAALGFFGLYAAVRASEERSGPWWGWAAAGLGGAALCKYSGLLFLPPALLWAWSRGARPGRLAALAAGALAPLSLGLAVDLLTRTGGFQGAWTQTAVSAAGSWPAWAHRLRSFLAFTGGLGVVTLVWPFRNPGRRPLALLAVVAACVLLFSPAHDAGRPVEGWDRLVGLVFACGGGASLLALAAERRGRGWLLWASWAGAAALLQLLVYWSVTSRLVLFVVVPLVLGLSEALEAELGERRFARLCAGGFVAAAALSFALAGVDRGYASAQRTVAEEVVAPRVARGQRVLFTGHWGLQHYLERAGALPYDAGKPASAQAAPGDLILISLANSNTDLRALPPHEVRDLWAVDSAAPLRLISAWGGSPETAANQAGFYSSTWGFLPFAFSREPLDRYLLLEVSP